MNSTKVLEQVESAQLGLGIIRSLIGIDADEVQNAAVKAYMDGNMELWQKRSGLESSGIPESESDDMGHTVSIGNVYHHYSDPNPVTSPTPDPSEVPPQPPPVTPSTTEPSTSNWTKAGIAAAVVLSGAALGYTLLKSDAPASVDRDTSVIISIPEEDRTL